MKKVLSGLVLYCMTITGGNLIADSDDLTHLSLEELMNIEVFSVSKKPEKLSETPAAAHVITQEDIRRSGATILPELFRLAPGLHVARVNSHSWAIGARGFSNLFANKLMVMMDGRNVCAPLFSGFHCDLQETLLEDLERIEVIRGPGATVWGANAVNGVINIITKSAEDTQGTLITGGGGSEEKGFGGVRYGGKLGKDLFFRVYAKYSDHDDTVLLGGGDNNDSWQIARGGFRIDWEASERNLFTLQGDIYNSQIDTTADDELHVRGGNLLGRWTRTISEKSNWQLLLYYDRAVRDDINSMEEYDVFDVDLNHQFPLGQRHDIVWGLGYRLSTDDIENTTSSVHDPTSRDWQLFSIFLQDEVSLIEDQVKLTLGSKFEHNDYTDFEVQPNARLFWRPHQNHAFWSAVSRATRTPSRAERDLIFRIPGPTPETTFSGNTAFDSEELTAYEIGYRWQATNPWWFDLVGFYHDYKDLRSFEPVVSEPPTLITVENNLEGESYGIELSLHGQPTHWWQIHAFYTYLEIQFHPTSGSADITSESEEGSNPHHQITLRSLLDLSEKWEFDTELRYVDSLPTFDIPSYLTLHLRLGWKPRDGLEISVVGENLLDNRHPEFFSSLTGTQRAEIEHSVYGKIAWQF